MKLYKIVVFSCCTIILSMVFLFLVIFIPSKGLHQSVTSISALFLFTLPAGNNGTYRLIFALPGAPKVSRKSLRVSKIIFSPLCCRFASLLLLLSREMADSHMWKTRPFGPEVRCRCRQNAELWLFRIPFRILATSAAASVGVAAAVDCGCWRRVFSFGFQFVF